MSFGAVAGGILKGRAKRQGRVALTFAAVSIGYRLFRRVTRLESRPSIRFARCAGGFPGRSKSSAQSTARSGGTAPNPIRSGNIASPLIVELIA